MIRRSAAVVLLAAASLIGVASSPGGTAGAADRPWLDSAQPVADRVAELLAQLTLDEKVQLMYGVARPAGVHSVGYVPGVPRLGIPALVQSDGPLGVHDSCFGEQVPGNCYQGPSTEMPSTSALAASFDPTLAQQVGAVLGDESRARGVDVLYGPGINIVRVPQGGRNFEYFSEDPYLTGRLASAWVTGLQSEGVAAEVKHFALNNQENGRKTTSSNADERTIRELYLPAWQQVTDAGALAVMCGNNLINATHACENTLLVRQILEGEWGWTGMVGSDYAATVSALGSVNGGLDQSFTGLDWGEFYRDLPDLVRSGQVSEDVIDEHVSRVLTLMFEIGMFDPGRNPGAVDVAGDGAVSREVAERGAVLLKNDQRILPLDASTTHSIAVIGQYAAIANPGGGGSSRVPPYYSVSPVQGIRDRAGSGINVTTSDGSDIAAASTLAAHADVAVVIVNDVEKEGSDRPDIELPGTQNALVNAIRTANPNTVVVLETGSAVTMPWLSRIHALLELWYPGQEGGAALASLLFGDVNPSGRLPVTFPVDLAQDCCNTAPRYPAQDGAYTYSEGLDVGYRWYDAEQVKPLFPFGFGQSYTSFRMSRLVVTPRTVRPGSGVSVQLDVTDTGNRAGTAVPQVYLQFPDGAGEPPHRLVGTDAVDLAPGQTRTVTFTVPASALQYWNTAAHAWDLAAGDYTLTAGASSRNLPLHTTIHANHAEGVHGISVNAPASIVASAPVAVTISNTSNDVMTKVGYSLDVPTGWSATLAAAAPKQLAAGASATVVFDVTAPGGAGPGTYVLTARSAWSGLAAGSVADAVSVSAG